jgi:predicted transcriptional regulator
MMTAPKDEAKKIIDSLPEDTTYEEILRELAFDTMIQRGLNDVEDGKVISNKEMENAIAQW